MNSARSRRALLLVAVTSTVLAVRPASAEDTKGKWQFGFGISYFATTDYIRSNSDIAIASSNAGDTEGLPPVTSVDERPDQNMLNEPTVQDDFRLDFNASYGLTRWLAIELAAGYMTSDVGNMEYFLKDVSINYGGVFPELNAPFCGPNANQTCYRYNINTPSAPPSNLFVPVGKITEIPVQASALVRFRPESPLDPYVGLGVGYLFTDLQTSDEFDSRSAGIGNLLIAAASEGEFTNSGHADRLPAEGQNGFTPAPMLAEVTSGFTYHAVGGVDYFVNDHFSVYVDARYTWTDASINITTDGAHQVLFATYAPGKLQRLGGDTANLWEDRGFASCPTCLGDTKMATEDGNGNGVLDPGIGEGEGILYFYPAGPNPNRADGTWRAGDPMVTTIDCSSQPAGPLCPWKGNGFLDSEDANGNRIMDRFRYYGVDVCSLPNPDPSVCGPADILLVPQYVFPGEGCTTSLPDPRLGNYLPEGCPTPPGAAGDLTNTGADNPSDIYIIQGGEIHLGGFSLGVGVKFTF